MDSRSMRMGMAGQEESGASMPVHVGRLASLPGVYGRASVDQDPQRCTIDLDSRAAGRTDSYQPFRSLGGHRDRGGWVVLEGAGMIQGGGHPRRPEQISYSILASSTILLNRGEEEPSKEDWMGPDDGSLDGRSIGVGTLATSTVIGIGGKIPSREDWMRERLRNSAGERNPVARIAGSTIYPI